MSALSELGTAHSYRTIVAGLRSTTSDAMRDTTVTSHVGKTGAQTNARQGRHRIARVGVGASLVVLVLALRFGTAPCMLALAIGRRSRSELV